MVKNTVKIGIIGLLPRQMSTLREHEFGAELVVFDKDRYTKETIGNFSKRVDRVIYLHGHVPSTVYGFAPRAKVDVIGGAKGVSSVVSWLQRHYPARPVTAPADSVKPIVNGWEMSLLNGVEMSYNPLGPVTEIESHASGRHSYQLLKAAVPGDTLRFSRIQSGESAEKAIHKYQLAATMYAERLGFELEVHLFVNYCDIHVSARPYRKRHYTQSTDPKIWDSTNVNVVADPVIEKPAPAVNIPAPIPAPESIEMHRDDWLGALLVDGLVSTYRSSGRVTQIERTSGGGRNNYVIIGAGRPGDTFRVPHQENAETVKAAHSRYRPIAMRYSEAIGYEIEVHIFRDYADLYVSSRKYHLRPLRAYTGSFEAWAEMVGRNVAGETETAASTIVSQDSLPTLPVHTQEQSVTVDLGATAVEQSSGKVSAEEVEFWKQVMLTLIADGESVDSAAKLARESALELRKLYNQGL